MLPSAGGWSGQDPELQELICEILFDLKSWSVEAGELWDNLKCHQDNINKINTMVHNYCIKSTILICIKFTNKENM